MIKFIQKYQKFFYIVITTVIVISFSFFGTYGSLGSSSIHEQVAFKTIAGDKITRGELEEMVFFLQTDTSDKRLYGPRANPNFLNDGVIRNDFLATGMAEQLVHAYPEVVKSDLDARLEREKRYSPYTHPKAPFISSEMVWSYFSPQMKQNLDALQKSKNALSEEAFKSRVNLYLAEKEFPSPYLAEVLRRQESQYGWIEKDNSLLQRDLSLFGYHSIDDWFGPKFSRLVAEFIFNAAALAESKGIVVTNAEAWADMVKNSAQSFQEMSKSPDFHFLSQSQYLNEQLRSMGMDAGKATKIWQKVLLFRRVFHDIANAQIIEPKTLMLPNTWSSEFIAGDFYHLPKPLRFTDLMDLAEFEVYLANTSKTDKGLQIADKSLDVNDILKRSPELVEKRYLAVIKKADKKSLEAKVSMRETLAWETDPDNFELLKKEFADLGIKTATTADARVEAIDSLPDTIRLKVDAFARSKIAAKHPEWIEQALGQSGAAAQVLSVRLKGGQDPLYGLKDRKALIDALDKVKLGEETQVVGDNNVYRIKVIDRSPNWEVVSFQDAKASGTLREMLDEKLNPLYLDARSKETGDKFKKENGEFKNFNEVKRDVAEVWLAEKLKNIKSDADASLKSKSPAVMIPDIAATLRFTGLAEKVKSSPNKDLFVKQESVAEIDPNKLAPKESWSDQFKFEREKKQITRSTDRELFDLPLKPGDFSPLMTPSNGDLSFVQVSERKAQVSPELLAKATLGIRSEIGSEAQRAYMVQVLEKIKSVGAISFEYLKVNEEGEVEIAPENDVSKGKEQSKVKHV